MSFKIITKFEETIAEFYGAPYAVATDCCTHAVELSLRLQKVKQTTCPKYTYISIPLTLKKLNITWEWSDEQWKDYYYLGNTNIIDAGVLWRADSYIAGTLMCLSFQFKKQLSLGRGGMILTDNKDSYEKLLKMSYDGRSRELPWAEQSIDTIGYHYYMTPETAQLGIEKFNQVKDLPVKSQGYQDYPNLTSMPVFFDQN